MHYRLRAVDSLVCRGNEIRGKAGSRAMRHVKLIKRIYASWLRKESVSFSENFFAVD
jgi:hypothetical protein